MELMLRVGGRRMLAAWAMITMCLMVGGCGGGADQIDELYASDAGKVMDCVETVQGAAGEPDGKRWEQIMADPDAIDKSQRKGYTKYFFRTQSTEIEISGDTATFPVKVGDPATGDEVSTVTWTAQKVGEDWKLKDTPLPAGLGGE